RRGTPGRGAGGAGAGPAGAAGRGAGALRDVLADRHGRGAPARIPRAGRRVRTPGGPGRAAGDGEQAGGRGEGAPGGRAVRWPAAVALAAATTSTAPPESTQQAIGYPSLFLLVLIGALIPVVPTGALVSSAAVVAFHQTAPFSLLLVFVTASLAAFLGDAAL